MRFKLTVHIEEHGGNGRQASTEGIIVEFHTRDSAMIPKQAAALFRELAERYQEQLQTPAKPLSHVSV